MSDAQLRRMDEIESLRQKAYTLSRSDRLGHLMIKSFDLIQSVHRDGMNSENLSWDLQALTREHAKTISEDPNSNEILRSLL
ncbi:hypothetical protein PMAYCL1PPCAC_11690, partial [Pristionchus mayeri]